MQDVGLKDLIGALLCWIGLHDFWDMEATEPHEWHVMTCLRCQLVRVNKKGR